MNLDTLRQERQKWLTWKNIKPYQEAIAALPEYSNVKVTLGDRVEIQIADLSSEELEQIKQKIKNKEPSAASQGGLWKEMEF